MHCPRCGTGASVGQPFCRSCGLNLLRIAEFLDEGAASETPGAEIARLKERQRKYENWGGIAGLSAAGLILILFVVLVFSQIILKGGLLIVPGVLLILLAIGTAVMVYFQASAKSLKDKLAQPPLPPAPLMIPEPIGTPSSVTERTTELLPAEQGGSTREL